MRWKTGPWRAPRLVQGVKRQLVECVADGKVFDGATVQSDLRRDPKSKLLQVRAEFLADLLLSRVTGLVADPRGVRLANCVVTGPLDLTRAAMQAEQVDRAVMPLECDHVDFEEPIRLDYSATGAIALTNCRLPGFHARGADIATELTLDDCTLYRRDKDIAPEYLKIDLDGATIGGDFHARRLRYEDVMAERKQRGRVKDPRFSPPGPLPFANVLIDADNSKIAGGVDLSFLDDGRKRVVLYSPGFAVLMGNFDNADIFGDFRATGARFAPTMEGMQSGDFFLSSRYPKCLDLRGAQVRGDVALDHIRTAGQVCIEDATLTQDLSIGGARLVNVECARERERGFSGAVIEAVGLAVGGSVHFVDRLRTYSAEVAESGWAGPKLPRGVDQVSDGSSSGEEENEQDGRLFAIGTIRITRTRITGDLDASGATICAVGLRVEGVALDMRSAEVGGSLFLDGRRDVGPGLFVGLVNLINIKVSGSVIFSGSWFRAPAGQQMGPQRIHLPVVQEVAEGKNPLGVLESESGGEWSDVDKLQIARTDRELENWKLNRLWRTCPSAVRPPTKQGDSAVAQSPTELSESPVALANREHWSVKPPTSQPMLTALGNLGIRRPLELSRRQLWRLRGGCRAIAMVDARVTGSVLFGIGPTAWGADRQDGKPLSAEEGTDGPSVVVGCVDLDRIRIDGNLRLTGGVFRAVTPVIPDPSGPAVADDDGPEPMKNGGRLVADTQGDANHDGDGGTGDVEAAASDSGPPDVSLSNPSTPGWTELKARVCLSLRSAHINGRFESQYFGPIPIYDVEEEGSAQTPIFCDIEFDPRSGYVSSRLEQLRQDLHIVPGFPDIDGFLENLGVPGRKVREPDCKAIFNDPARYVDEMVAFLDLAANAESIDDMSLGGTLPALPRVHNLAGWYPLRPDGLFDLSGAAIQSIFDHPCHGWPTSDGHLELNGCTYNYITLSHESSFKVLLKPDENADTGTRGEEFKKCDRGAPKAPLTIPRARPDGPTERRGTSVAWRFIIWGKWRIQIACRMFVYALFFVPYGACQAACWLGLADRDCPKCAKLWPGRELERHRLRSVRYIEYAVASFRIRNDSSASPEARRINWLEQQYPGAGPGKHDFRPQPYEQLARVMRATGYSLDADQIAAAKRSMRWRAGVFGLVQRGFDIFLWLTSKYTYSPTRIFLWLAALTVVTVLISGAAHDRGMFQANNGSGDFSAWLYAIDVIIPIVEFGYVDDWSVKASPDACGAGGTSGGGGLLDLLNIDCGRRLEWALGLMTGFGSLFTALAVITFTGVMRRD